MALLNGTTNVFMELLMSPKVFLLMEWGEREAPAQSKSRY